MPDARAPTLISLAAGAHQVPLIRAAQARGLSVVAVDRDPAAPGLAMAEHALLQSTHDDGAVIAALSELRARCDFAGLVHRTSGRALLTAARISQAFGLRGLTETAARLATEKSTLREFCEKEDIPMPRGARARSARDVDLDPPYIVKPDFPVVGKQDVRYVATRAGLAAAIERAVRASANDLAEVEEYIDGLDVSCMFWMHAGEAHAVTTYDEIIGIADDGSLLPYGIHLPSILSGDPRGTGIESIPKRLAAGLPEVSTLMIVSLRIDPTGAPHVIELHADLGGDRIAEDLFPVAAPELDFFNLAVRLATGESFHSIASGAHTEGFHLLLYQEAEEGQAPRARTKVLSSSRPSSSIEHLALAISPALGPSAIPPAYLCSWIREASRS